jgi:F0F1-type ATP synthase assembly protein I
MAEEKESAITDVQKNGNLIGAGLVFGALIGVVIGAITAGFAFWIPTGAIVGILIGLAMRQGLLERIW